MLALTMIIIVIVMQEIIPHLEGRRVKIEYDTIAPMISLLFFHIVPAFSHRRLFFVIYSDTICRRQSEIYRSIAGVSDEIPSILDRSHIIKIGKRSSVSFGNLYAHIPTGDPEDELSELKDILSRLDNKDLIVFRGLYMIPEIYGKDIVKNILDIFDSIPQKATVIVSCRNSYEDAVTRLMDKLFDVIIKIKRAEEMFFEVDNYYIGIKDSIIPELKPGVSRYKISHDGCLVKLI
jgi:hypothetical protein